MKGALLIALKKRKASKEDDMGYGEMEEKEEPSDDDAKEDAGQQLAEALDSGSGEAIYTAITDIIRLYRK